MTITRYWFTILQAADIAGIDEATVRTEIRQNHLHPRRTGPTVLIVDAELDRWLRVRFPSRRSSARPAEQRPYRPTAEDPSMASGGFSVEEWLHQTESR